MIRIAIYGKGGIGKSTTTSNLAAALSEKFKVMQIGCDPKADSTKNLLGKFNAPSVLSQIAEKGDALCLNDIVFEGYNGVYCVESGGPTPGIGCAGLGIISAFQKLEELQAYEVFKPDIVLYDVLGDVVCGGFAMPMRGTYSDHVFVVTSGEMMALYAASNIAQAIKGFKGRGYACYSGLILNERKVKDELALVQKLAEETETSLIQHIRRSPYVQQAEELGKTVIEAFPESDIAGDYRTLADTIIKICCIADN